MRRLLMKAVESGEQLEMIYQSNKGEFTQRVIKIDSIHEELIHAYCFSRKCIRTFNIRNILSVRPVRTKFRKGA
jgi:predicted DNA-binding transcriptional regulator YafY